VWVALTVVLGGLVCGWELIQILRRKEKIPRRGKTCSTRKTGESKGEDVESKKNSITGVE